MSAELEKFAQLQKRRWQQARTTPAERARRLLNLEKTILKYESKIYAAVREDFGKHPREMELTEVIPCLSEIRHIRRHLPEWMRVRSVDTPVTLWGASSEVWWEARGVVLILSPWNYPFYLSMAPLAAAVAAGNVVCLKPSEKTPRVSAVMEEIVKNVFPSEEVCVVQGQVEVAQALLKLPFEHIFFTGSTAVGKHVMTAAAQSLASVTLELGGKSPAIVLGDADISWAAERLAWGKFINAGQTCVAPDYVLVEASVHDELIDQLHFHLERLYGHEASWNERADFCRMIDVVATQRMQLLLEEARGKGARLHCGGQVDLQQRYVAPTILTEVPDDVRMMQEEIFGPLLPVRRVASWKEAVEYVNARPHPLSLYVFTKSARHADAVLAATTAGGSAVNEVVSHLANPELPFGGVGPSGCGSYHGYHGFKAFSHERAVLRQHHRGVLSRLRAPYDRWPGWLTRLISWTKEYL